MCKWPLRLVCLLVALCGAGTGVYTPAYGARPVNLLLASQGKVRLPIVLSEKASTSTKAVAAELAVYLRRITGAPFAVTTGDGTTGIVLGTWKEFPIPGLERELEIRGGIDGKEAYAIRTETKRLLLIGATDLAVSHAAFRFLESVGCRWFFPAPEWEVVPTEKTLYARVDESDRPVILSRSIWFAWGFFDQQAQAEYAAWCRHNRQASSFAISNGHADEEILGWHRADFQAHPEYLALVNGKRQGSHFCYSNPGLQQVLVRYALGYFARNPGAEMVSLETADGSAHCQCEECVKMGTVSNQFFHAINVAARAVAEKYPGKMIGTLAYNQHCDPPDFDLEPNVYVQLAAGFFKPGWNFERMVQEWPKRSRLLGYYDYFSVWLWDFDRPGARAGSVGYLRRQIPYYADHHASSISAESGNNWGPNGLGYYIANRLMWNPRADVDRLLQDFYTRAFGPAAPAMRRYYETFWFFNEPPRLLEGFQCLQEAERLARKCPEILARIDHLKIYLTYLSYRWQFDHAPDFAARKAMVLPIFELTFRSRRTYMNHWCVIADYWSHRAGQEYRESTWSSHIGRPEPHRIAAWEKDVPYTREQIDEMFRREYEYVRQVAGNQ